MAILFFANHDYLIDSRMKCEFLYLLCAKRDLKSNSAWYVILTILTLMKQRSLFSWLTSAPSFIKLGMWEIAGNAISRLGNFKMFCGVCPQNPLALFAANLRHLNKEKYSLVTVSYFLWNLKLMFFLCESIFLWNDWFILWNEHFILKRDQ
jgi:hypothetical protein